MRVVLDTNLVVSSLVFGGGLGWLRDAIVGRRVVPLVCHQTIQELTRVLAYRKLRLAPEEQLRLLVQYLAPASPAVLQEPWPALPARCRDRKDEMFIALAIQEQVSRVSGDADLTSMAAALPLPILRAPELRLFLEAPDRQH